EDGVLLVEAGTGTGKTLAYLLPAIASGRRVVVSTHTKALQDQIMEHDLPLLEEHLPIPFEAACMKGLSNYICRRRHAEFRKTAPSDMRPYSAQLQVLEEWMGGTAMGDRSELEALAEDADIWPSVTSSSETRIGKRCTFFDECFVTAMRARAQAANIVVVNHHLFFADLVARNTHGTGVIPDYEVVIFDEAHQIEDVATRFFGVQVSTGRIETLARDAERSFGAAKIDLKGHGRQVLLKGSEFFASLPRSSVNGRAPLPQEDFSGAVEERMFALDNALDGLATWAKLQAGESEAIGQIARRAGAVRDQIATIAEGGGGTHVTWTESRGRRVSIGASPVDVSELLREDLFYRTPSVVLTSATLTTGGSYDFIKGRLGIDFNARERTLASPFEYKTQAALYLTRKMPDPRDAAFADAAEESINELTAITGGGAFVLCTSVRMMHELATRADDTYPKLVQGEAPKGVLLDRFRTLGNAVLYATATFWEGVDVPGEALRLVIIDKLPFEVPSDPLVRARCERLELEGTPSFMKYLVPSAALTLKQGFGRLIRTRQDRGIVAVLDRRLVTKGYGQVFLDSLPPARRCTTLDRVTAFWQTANPAAEAS
ncbi:MAG: helicase C-terminal domain-containing protein, partial [Myxococcota bacterium]